MHIGLSKKGDQKSSHKIGFKVEAFFLASPTKKLCSRKVEANKIRACGRILLDVVPCSSPVISFEVLHQIEPNKVLEIYIQKNIFKTKTTNFEDDNVITWAKLD